MELVEISSYDTFGSPYNKNWAKFSPKSDFYVTFKNVKKQSKLSNKTIYPSQIALEITKYLGKNHDKLFNLNKAYDLFIGSVINKVFDGAMIADHEDLNIEIITGLFRDVVEPKQSEAPTLFDLKPATAYGNI